MLSSQWIGLYRDEDRDLAFVMQFSATHGSFMHASFHGQLMWRANGKATSSGTTSYIGHMIGIGFV